MATHFRCSLLALVLVAFPCAAEEAIGVGVAGGVYYVPVRINDQITLDFLLDTGAADVLMPLDVALTLVRTGTITEADVLGNREYEIADGSLVVNTLIRFRSLRVGNRVLRNVVGAVGTLDTPLLLGQGALRQLEPWRLDTARGLLILGEPDKPQALASVRPTEALPAPDYGGSARAAVNVWTDTFFEAIHPEIGAARIAAEQTGLRTDWLAIRNAVQGRLRQGNPCGRAGEYFFEETGESRDEIADAVFHARHPELGGRQLDASETAYVQEWREIRRRVDARPDPCARY